MQTPWKVLLGLLGAAALVTIITVPVVLLNKGKFKELLKIRVLRWGQEPSRHARGNEAFCREDLARLPGVIEEASEHSLCSFCGEPTH